MIAAVVFNGLHFAPPGRRGVRRCGRSGSSPVRSGSSPVRSGDQADAVFARAGRWAPVLMGQQPPLTESYRRTPASEAEWQDDIAERYGLDLDLPAVIVEEPRYRFPAAVTIGVRNEDGRQITLSLLPDEADALGRRLVCEAERCSR